MRALALALLLLGGCQGYLKDRVRPKGAILAGELARFIPDAGRRTCVGDQLRDALSVWQLRQLADLAEVGRRSGRIPLDPSGFVYVAGQVTDPRVTAAVTSASKACNLGTLAAVPSQPPVQPAPSISTSPPPPGDTRTTALSPAWVNLGAAVSGQAIAVEASSVAQEAGARRAWFRLTNPGQSKTTAVSYLLRVDCRAKTINPLAFRRYAAATGAVESERDFGPNGEGALPVETGTVMEIAYLALCT